MSQENWYKLEQAHNLSAQETASLTREYVNPGMVKLFGMLGFDQANPVSAQGVYINLAGGRQILDMSGGNGVLGLGHNHPRILAARAAFAAGNRLELCKAFLSPYVAALSANMSALLGKELKYSFFCNSGAEAIEGALKMAQKHHGTERLGIVYTDQSFHGKSHAAMSISSLDNSRENFQLLEKCFQVQYGDAAELEALFKRHCKSGQAVPDLCAFVVEAVHGTRIIFPPEGYLRRVRQLCTEYDVLLIADEIYTGFGHTGHWFAYQQEGIQPDIVCYSKAFGGGKASIAGYTAREQVFMKAYGKPEEAMMHSSTFSGMGEECATAIEALNVFKEEGLIERARELGAYLGDKLADLAQKYPQRIKEVRGRGLLWGVELKPPLEPVEQLVGKILPDKPILSTLAGAMVLSHLFHGHNVLAYLGFTRRNLVVFSPALIVQKEELDRAVAALDAVLSMSWMALGQALISRKNFH